MNYHKVLTSPSQQWIHGILHSFRDWFSIALILQLVTAAIVLWNTVYLAQVINALRNKQMLDEELVKYLSPLGWEHISLTGDYVWLKTTKTSAERPFRPLRNP